MKIPKILDFSEVNMKKLFSSSSKEYKKMMTLDDEGEWKDYVNEMLLKGISVIYDPSGDYFIIKPVAFKENNNRMQFKNSKKLSLSDFDFLNENDTNTPNSIVFEGTRAFMRKKLIPFFTKKGIKMKVTEGLEEDEYKVIVNENLLKENNISLEALDKKLKSIAIHEEHDDYKGFQKLREVRLKKLKESNDNKYLLYDNEDEEIEELPGNDMKIETSVDDLIHLSDEDVSVNQQPQNPIQNNPTPEQPNQNLTVQDIENIVKQFLSGQNTVGDQQTSVPDSLANGSASTINQSVEPQMDVLDTEFPENKQKLSVVENKIENDESYLDILNGDITSNQTDEIVGSVPPQQVLQNQPQQSPEPIDNSGSEFEIYEPEEEPEMIEEAPNNIGNNSPTDYEDGDFDLIEPEPADPIAQNNSVVTAAGSPVKIQITGWLITIPEVNSLAESIKKNGGKLRKLESSNNKELFLFVESNKKIYKVQYEDKSKVQSSRPWSIKYKKFASLQEAVKAISKNELVNNKEKSFKDLIGNNKELSTRTLSSLKESNIFEDVRNKKNSINYIPGWNVKSVGSLDLKKGMNEVFSNITEHSSKSKNTLFKTKDGNYYLIKGNLGEASMKGVKRHLIDLEGQKDYGVGQVIGLYENNYKGLGNVMFKIKRTSIPLLVWKRK